MRKFQKTYSEMSRLNTFEERFTYLKLQGGVGSDTFGFDRYLNQQFYNSTEWKRIRTQVIARDLGCDLGIPDHVIFGKVIIHHMNPITKDDIIHSTDILMNPEFLICVSFDTHNAIHYGTKPPEKQITERKPNDTCPWR